MTIRECIRKRGIECDVDGALKRWNIVHIGFVNCDGCEDETSFDVAFAGDKAGQEDLVRLFADFCEENGFPTNTVCYVRIVAAADTKAELEEMDM